MAQSVRRKDGFVRYAFAVSYQGGKSLGFTYQSQENSLLSDGTDLRGLYSIEGRIRRALSALVGQDDDAIITSALLDESRSTRKLNEYNNFENFQVSSRTDRGVHALKNTFHVDIRPRRRNDTCWAPQNLHHGINFHLVRQSKEDMIQQHYYNSRRQGHPSKHYHFLQPHNPEHDVRILSCRVANHRVRNLLYNPSGNHENQLEYIDWNARYTATTRTYCYRILHMVHPTKITDYFDVQTNSPEFSSLEDEYIIPFEAGRSWLVHSNTPLNIHHMRQASTLFLGKQDFSSFRAKGCERSSPVVQMNYIHITSEPISYPFWLADVSTFYSTMPCLESPRKNSSMNMITIMIQGESFLYRQVRNTVGCLLKVGQEKLSFEDVKTIIEARDRTKAPLMAPAHGLYLIDVQHNWY